MTMKVVAQNRRARFDYQIEDTFEAGLVLEGHEVKSCRAGQVHLAGSYVSLLSNVPLLRSAKISKYAHASGLENYDPGRERKLLLKKNDIKRLTTALQEKGVSLIPLEVRAGKHIKVLLGLGKGKKRYDKRQSIKDRDVKKRIKQGEEI